MAKPPRNRNVTEPQHREIQQRLEDTALGIVGSGTLGNLTDVTITGAATGNILVYDGSEWVNTYAVDENFNIQESASGGGEGYFGFTASGLPSQQYCVFHSPQGVAFGLSETNRMFSVNSIEDCTINGRDVTISVTGDVNCNPSGNLSIKGGATTFTTSTVLTLHDWTFFFPPMCSTAPTSGDDLCNKTYVDGKTYALDDLTDVTIGTPGTNQFIGWNGAAWINRSIDLDALSDVATSSESDNDVLMFNFGLGQWENAQMVISDLSDVNTAGATSGQFLRYDGADWVDDTVVLNDISDVSAAGPTAGQVLEWSGAAWAPATRVIGDNNDVTISGAISGQHLEYNGSAWVNATPSTSNPGLAIYGQSSLQNLVSSNGAIDWGSELYDRNGDFSSSGKVITLPSNTKVLVEWSLIVDNPDWDNATDTTADWAYMRWERGATASGAWTALTTETSPFYIWSPHYDDDSGGMTAPSICVSGHFVYDTTGTDEFLRLAINSNNSGTSNDVVGGGANLKITILG